MILNEFGRVANDEWLNTPNIRKNIQLGEFIIMPNHMHGIIQIMHAPNNELQFSTGELNSPQGIELNSPQGIKLHSPQRIKLNSPQSIELISPQGIELNSRNNKELNSPKSSQMNANDKRELNLSENTELNPPVHKGVCKTPPQTPQTPQSPQTRHLPQSPSQTIGAIIRGYKSSVTKQLRLLGLIDKLWQRNYHEHIIRNEKAYENISNYIINNPAKWDKDKFNNQ
jgi:REP element-mobilizing transposase RayT